MLDVDIDTRSGILFVRLFGDLTKDTKCILNRDLIPLINNVGINNIVINITNVHKTDIQGLKILKKCYKLCDKSILCINPNQINLLNGLKFAFDEMSAYNLIKS